MKEVIDIILSNDLYGVGEYTDIAKGKYSIPKSFKDAKEKIKRIWRLRK